MARAKNGREKENERVGFSRDDDRNGGLSFGQSGTIADSNGYGIQMHDTTNAAREPGEISPSEAEDGLNWRYEKQDHFTPTPKKRKYSPVEPEPGQLAESPASEGGESTLRPRDITTSRWADNDNSLGDATFVEYEGKRRKVSLSADSYEDRLDSSEPSEGKIMSPELRDYSRERSRSLDNGAGEDIERTSKDEFEHNFRGNEPCDGEFDQREPMEMYEEDNSDFDSCEEQPESDSPATPSPVPRSPLPPQRTIDMLQGCRNVDEFERLNKIDEGTYGVVFRARDKKSGEIVALKKVKMEKEREGFPMTSLREINVLLSFHHPSIVDVKEVVVGSKLDNIFMVMEYMEHDLKSFMETMKQPFSQSEVKCLMLQLLEGVKYLHDNWVLHRDLKTSNLLLNNRGELKICDFGLARQYGSPLKTYTHMVVTLWYRAPELLLGAKKYSTAIDMWSLGCIMAELLAKEPLFTGKSEIDQLDKVFRTLGTPNEKIWPDFVNLPGVKCRFVKQPFLDSIMSWYNKLREKFPAMSCSGRPTLSESGFDLLNRLLTYDPNKRITSEEALKHKWFREVPLPKSKELMPTYPARNDYERRSRRSLKSPDPCDEGEP
eukprot:Gb_15109 [translate_table: standard]